MAKDIKRQPREVAPRYSDPFSTLRSEMDRLFDTFMGGLPTFPSMFTPGVARGFALTPSLDVKETDKEIVVDATVFVIFYSGIIRAGSAIVNDLKLVCLFPQTQRTLDCLIKRRDVNLQQRADYREAPACCAGASFSLGDAHKERERVLLQPSEIKLDWPFELAHITMASNHS